MNPLFFLITFFYILFPSKSWVYDFEIAKENAKVKNQQILMVFAGSDWCIPCKKFEKTILSDKVFLEFQNNNLVLLYLDFPAKKKNKLATEQRIHNENLAEKYNSSGVFPKILLLSPDGEILQEIKFKNQNPQQFIEQLNLSQ